MTKLIILWSSTIFLFSFACLPYKSRKNPDQLSPNELLVTNQQCTDCATFLILKGQLEIPEDLSKYWTINPFEFNSTADNTPFEVVDESQYNFDLITDNSFVLTGKVVGVDSTSFETNIVPIYKIDSWFPTKYYPKIWTLSSGTLLIYIVTCIILFIASIAYSFQIARRGN